MMSLFLILQVIIALLVVGLSIAIYLHIQEIQKQKHIPGVSQLLPMMPLYIPFLAPYMYVGSYRTIVKLGQEKFGDKPLFRITLFRSTLVVLNNLEDTKHVYLKNASNYEKPDGYDSLRIYGENIVSIPGGDVHRRHRKIVEPAFKESNLRELVDISNRSTDMLLKRCERNENILEVNKDLTDVTMDIIGKSAFGYNLHIFNEEEDDQLKHTLFDETKHKMSFYDALEITNMKGVAERVIVPSWLRWLPLPILKQIHTAVDEVELYLQEIIAERKSNLNQKRVDLLSLLVNSNEQEDEKLSAREMIADAWLFMFAGHETSASSIGQLLVEFARHQDIQEKAYQEIQRVLEDGRDATYDDLTQLTYVNNCIKESLRLHAPTQAAPKRAMKSDVLSGYKIPKDTVVWLDVYLTHLNENNWKDPYRFNPDRFYEKYDPISFLAFSYGSRKCAGMTFSLVESVVIVSKLLQKYKVEFNGEDTQPKERVLITIKIDFQELKLVPRDTK